jgi:hypothetical protein
VVEKAGAATPRAQGSQGRGVQAEAARTQQHAVDKAQAAMAEQEYTRRAAAVRFEIEPIEEKLSAEEADWDKERQRLKAAFRRAAE